MSYKDIEKFNKRGLLDSKLKINLEICEIYVMDKQVCVKFKTGQHTTSVVLDYIILICGEPPSVSSKGGHRYFVSFIDDFSRKV